MVLGEVLVRVPVATREAVVGATPNLHEADAALQQTAGQQAVAAEVLGDRYVEAIELARRRRLAGEVEDFRGAELEAGRQLVGGDAGVEPGVALAPGLVCTVELLEQGEAVGFALRGDKAAFRRKEV